MSNVINNYLARYAQDVGSNAIDAIFEYCLVVPCFAEEDSFYHNLSALLDVTEEPVCVIVVVNAPDNAVQEDVVRNHALLDYFQRRPRRDQHAVHLVDRTTIPLPHKQGVGLARKIACDLALRFYSQGRIKTPFVFVSDADVVFPHDYFSRVSFANHVAAWVFPHTHAQEDDPVLAKGIRDYEAYLDAYVHGLRKAGSPYAFHTIGSTMVVAMEAYAKVRGFPKRAAAEDFYMLNKLAKVGEIVSLEGAPLILAGRLSHRVPFGTGDAMYKVKNGKQYVPYPDLHFQYLEAWLSSIRKSSIDSAFDVLLKVESEARKLDVDRLMPVLKGLGVFEFLQKARTQAKDDKKFREYIHTWFDAFRTLKFIHALAN